MPLFFLLVMCLLYLVPLKSNALDLDLGADTALCEGPLLILDAGVYDDYFWSDGTKNRFLGVSQSGDYWVAVDSAGVIDRDTIFVTFYNNPVSSFEVDTVCQGTELGIQNFSFGNPDTITQFIWSFGNGEMDTTELPLYSYSSSGIKNISLKVFNQYGCFDSSSVSTLIYDLPIVDLGLSSDTLNIGDTLLVTPFQTGQNPVWTPDDRVSDPFNDTTMLFPNSSRTYELTVSDSNGCMNSASLNLLVNFFPDANDDLLSVDPESSTNIDILANDDDPENGIIEISIVEGPFHGTASVTGDSMIVYSSDPTYAGYDTILYKICDFGKPPLCDFAQVIILVRNTRPEAENDFTETENGMSVEIDVLKNDFDINSSQSIEITFISNPENGTVENTGNGTFTYTSNIDFEGTEEFYYLLCDNGIPQLCDTGLVIIEVYRSPVKVINSFSPNGDGVFDVFTIEGIHNYPNNKLIVFSRWGDIIIERNNYKNDWDGSRGFNEEVPEGVYYYQLELDGGQDPLKGYLYLKR